jgi:hypothetical protein
MVEPQWLLHAPPLLNFRTLLGFPPLEKLQQVVLDYIPTDTFVLETAHSVYLSVLYGYYNER